MAVVWAGHAEVTGGQGWLPAKKKETGTKLSFRVSLAERWDAKVYAGFILFPQRGTSRGRVVQPLSETTIHLPGCHGEKMRTEVHPLCRMYPSRSQGKRKEGASRDKTGTLG